MDADNDSPKQMPLDNSIVDGPPPFQLDEIKQSDDDEPSEFGDEDALLSVGEGSVEPLSGSARNNEKDGSHLARDSHTDTRERSSHGKNSSQDAGTEANTSYPSDPDTRSVFSGSIMTGIKTAEIRKNKMVVPIASERMTNLTRKSLEHISDFSLGDLVGRDSEVSQLKTCFERMVQASGTMSSKGNGTPQSSSNFRLLNKEVVLLKGMGGIGKSVIARTLKDEVGNDGIFVEGKFDMNSTDEPYSAIASAYCKICQHIKQNLVQAIPNVQKDLEKNLGDEVKLLVQLIPDLIGLLMDESDETKSSTIDISTMDNGLDRMRYAFRVLTKIFSKACSPMVLFLDDLQWADISSLQMIDFLLTDTQNPSPLMILGCYRSEEVDENSLLYNKIIAMREKSDKHGFSMTEMEIGAFQVHNIEAVIEQVMPTKKKQEAKKLAELCLKRTLGNVFFVLEFLRMLQHEQLVQYDLSSLHWTWDLAKIEEATMSTANVAMLLQERMRKLPQQVQSFLQCCAYLGSTFSVASITAVWNTYGRRLTEGKMQKSTELLETILAKDFVEKYGTRHYRWVHDKIQEAALDVKPIRDSFALDIGTSLYYSLDPNLLEEDLFTVVDLINAGNAMKRPEYGEVNLRAAQKAMSVSAYQAAAKYANHGIGLLEKTGWVESRSLMVKLYTVSAESEVILGNVEVAEQRCQEVLRREEVSDTEKLQLKIIKERVLSSAEMRLEEALEYCLELLKELGCVLYKRKVMVPVQAIRKSLASIKKLKKLPEESYDSMTRINDRKQRAIVHLLSRVVYLSLTLSNFLMSQLATCKMIEMMLEHGIHEGSAVGLATFSYLVVSVNRDYETGFKFAKTAMHLIEKFGNLRNGEAMITAYSSAMAWKLSLEEVLHQFLVSYAEALKVGDTEYGYWGLQSYEIFIPYQIGRSLNDLLDAYPALLLQCEESSQALHILTLRVFKQVHLNLKKITPNDFIELEGEAFSKIKEGEVDKANLPNILFGENELYFFSGDYVAAANRALKVRNGVEKLFGAHYMTFIDTYHRAASLYAAAIQTQQRKFKGAAKKLRGTMIKWEKSGNPNLKYYALHLNAEQAVVDKKLDDADRLYKEAIESVTEMRHLHHCGFIRERYADFLERDKGMEEESKKWLKESIEYYQEWGAEGRVKTLESRL